MKFDRPQSVSFKPFDAGDYVGVLVGFSYVGLHGTKEYGDKPKCMLRWEIHDLLPPHDPILDDEKQIHVVTQAFPATIRGESSWLYKCLVAHGIAVPGGACAESKEWHGRCARLTVVQAPGDRGKTFMNVTGIEALDPPVNNVFPKLTYEHWEPSDDVPPPIWAKFMIERSVDLYHLADGAGGRKPQTQQAPASHPANPGPYQRPVARAEAPPVDDYDDQDIPFNCPLAQPEEEMDWVGLKW